MNISVERNPHESFTASVDSYKQLSSDGVNPLMKKDFRIFVTSYGIGWCLRYHKRK